MYKKRKEKIKLKYPKKVSIDFDWKPSKSSKITLVEQIVSYVKMKISSGDWLIGQKLPSQRTLAEKLNVNRSTIVDAYSELLSLGIIESNYGNGTIIKNNTWSLLFLNASTKWSEYISSGIHKENLQTVQTINKLEYDESIIRLSTGEMAQDLFPHEMMKIILNRIPNKVFSYNYVEPLGLLPLRESICSHLKKIGIKANPSQVLIVSGSLQALQLIAISILKPGSTVFVEKPSYIKSLGIFESNGINMKGIPLDQSGLIPWMINSGNTSNTNSILYTIPTFHNPTGITMSADRRFELIDFCKKTQLPIIEDDAY